MRTRWNERTWLKTPNSLNWNVIDENNRNNVYTWNRDEYRDFREFICYTNRIRKSRKLSSLFIWILSQTQLNVGRSRRKTPYTNIFINIEHFDTVTLPILAAFSTLKPNTRKPNLYKKIKMNLTRFACEYVKRISISNYIKTMR